MTLQGGSYGHKRFDRRRRPAAERQGRLRALNGMYEDSDSFRDAVGLERYGVNTDR